MNTPRLSNHRRHHGGEGEAEHHHGDNRSHDDDDDSDSGRWGIVSNNGSTVHADDEDDDDDAHSRDSNTRNTLDSKQLVDVQIVNQASFLTESSSHNDSFLLQRGQLIVEGQEMDTDNEPSDLSSVDLSLPDTESIPTDLPTLSLDHAPVDDEDDSGDDKDGVNSNKNENNDNNKQPTHDSKRGLFHAIPFLNATTVTTQWTLLISSFLFLVVISLNHYMDVMHHHRLQRQQLSNIIGLQADEIYELRQNQENLMQKYTTNYAILIHQFQNQMHQYESQLVTYQEQMEHYESLVREYEESSKGLVVVDNCWIDVRFGTCTNDIFHTIQNRISSVQQQFISAFDTRRLISSLDSLALGSGGDSDDQACDEGCREDAAAAPERPTAPQEEDTRDDHEDAAATADDDHEGTGAAAQYSVAEMMQALLKTNRKKDAVPAPDEGAANRRWTLYPSSEPRQDGGEGDNAGMDNNTRSPTPDKGPQQQQQPPPPPSSFLNKAEQALDSIREVTEQSIHKFAESTKETAESSVKGISDAATSVSTEFKQAFQQVGEVASDRVRNLVVSYFDQERK